MSMEKNAMFDFRLAALMEAIREGWPALEAKEVEPREAKRRRAVVWT
jgi:hypothetical protein